MPIQSTAPAGSGPPSSGARRGVSALARAYGGAMMETRKDRRPTLDPAPT